jgi:DNA-binding NtrC family response regulator
VLIIDDEPLVVKVLSSIIRHDQPTFSIEPCSSPRLAVQKIIDGHFDAVVTDVIMPEFNGWHILERVRDTRPCTPVLLVTGTKQATIAARAFDHGAFDFLGKPIDRPALVWSVTLAIKTHRLQRRIELRRVYIEQLRESMNRRWEQPVSVPLVGVRKPLDGSMGAAVARFEAAVAQYNKTKERTERLLRRSHELILERSRRWLEAP